MKLPSIFRTVSHTRFEIKPRYYDPIKEEIEERTSRIRQELENEGVLPKSGSEEEGDTLRGLGSGIKGAFSSRGIKPKNTSMVSSAGVIRSLLFFFMIIGAFGFIYIGPEIVNYLLIGAMALGGGYFLFRFLKRSKDE